MAVQLLRRLLSVVYAPHLLRWHVFVPNASPEQVHGALSHTVNDHSWYSNSPKLVYEPKRQMLDQRPTAFPGGEPQRKIFLAFAMTAEGTIVSAKQRAVGELAITGRVLVLSFLILGLTALVERSWLPTLMFLGAFAVTRVAIEAIERRAARDLQRRIHAAVTPGTEPST